jgi:hypothetical protein
VKLSSCTTISFSKTAQLREVGCLEAETLDSFIYTTSCTESACVELTGKPAVALPTGRLDVCPGRTSEISFHVHTQVQMDSRELPLVAAAVCPVELSLTHARSEHKQT